VIPSLFGLLSKPCRGIAFYWFDSAFLFWFVFARCRTSEVCLLSFPQLIRSLASPAGVLSTTMLFYSSEQLLDFYHLWVTFIFFPLLVRPFKDLGSVRFFFTQRGILASTGHIAFFFKLVRSSAKLSHFAMLVEDPTPPFSQSASPTARSQMRNTNKDSANPSGASSSLLSSPARNTSYISACTMARAMPTRRVPRAPENDCVIWKRRKYHQGTFPLPYGRIIGTFFF